MAGEHEQPSRRPARAPDFSPRAVSRAVLGTTLQKPHVLYPAAVGILGGVATALLGPAFMLPAVIGGAVGLGAWAIEYAFRRDKHARDYVQSLHQALAGRVDETMRVLHREFLDLRFEPAIAQIDRLRDKYEAYAELLRRKLDPNEMTFSRYLGMGEQVFLGGLDNLARISDALRGASSNDDVEIRTRIRDLQRDGIDSQAQDQEIAALRARLDLMERQREKVFGWLAENEAAMTAMDKVMAEIAEMNTVGSATMKMEHAMQELESLAKRAQSYSRQ
jgi:chaperonin cofactor prefoldin